MTIESVDPQEQMVINEVSRDVDPRSRFGFYRGIVEDIDDPERLERAKVRVWAVHGPKDRTPRDALPWATVAEPFGGAYDTGSFLVPPVGASVIVGFEQGIEDYPFIIGTFRGRPVRNESNPNAYLSEGDHGVERVWQPPDNDTETPKDVYEEKAAGDHHPTRGVVAKSYKGHTISYDDGDGKENLRITDRAGQVLEFHCPVAPDAQFGTTCRVGNSAQRGTRSAIRGDQLPQDAMRDKKAHIRFKDLAGQEVFLDAKSMNERIRILSRNEQGSSTQSLELASGKGKEFIRLKDKTGSIIEMDPNGFASITLQDNGGNRVSLQRGGILEIRTSADLDTTVTRNSKIQVGGSKTETVIGSETSSVLGNLSRAISNDASLGVLGNTVATIGGALQLLISNAPVPAVPANVPSPSDTPLDVKLNLGGYRVDTNAGDGELHTLLGALKLHTTAGNASLYTGTGNVYLGLETAPYAVMRGPTYNTALTSFLTSLSTYMVGITALAASSVTAYTDLAAKTASPGTLNPLNSGFNTLLGAWTVFTPIVATFIPAISAFSSAQTGWLSTKVFTE